MPGYERDKQSRCFHHLMLAWQNGYVPGFQPGYGGSIPSVSSINESSIDGANALDANQEMGASNPPSFQVSNARDSI